MKRRGPSGRHSPARRSQGSLKGACLLCFCLLLPIPSTSGNARTRSRLVLPLCSNSSCPDLCLVAAMNRTGAASLCRHARTLHCHRFTLLRRNDICSINKSIHLSYLRIYAVSLVFVLFRPGELADIFAGDEFEILVDEAGELTTRGSVVPANFFACRKKVAVPSQN